MANIMDIESMGTNRYSSAALENNHQVTTTQSILYGFDGANTDTSNAIFIQVFDLASAPAANAVPITSIGVPARGTGTSVGNGNFSYSGGTYGIKFVNGIYIAASSTDGLYTSISTNKTLFNVQYAHEDGSGNL